MDSDGDEPFEPPPPLRRNTGNTGSFNRPPQRRQTRHYGAASRYVTPRNAPVTPSWPYYQEPDNLDESSPAVYPLPLAPSNDYAYAAYGTRPVPLSTNRVFDYAAPPPYRVTTYHYRDPDGEPEYERRGPYRRRSSHEYTRSLSQGSDRSQVRRRRERSRYSSVSSDEDFAARPSQPPQYRYRDVRRREIPATRVRIYNPRRDDNYTDEEDDYERIPEGKVFSFVPIRADGQSEEYETTSGNLETTEVKPNEGGPSPARLVQVKERTKDDSAGFSSSIADRMLHISESQYSGDAYYDGSHSVKLTASHDTKRSRLSLFRWLHIQQRQLNLDELSAEISRIPNLSSEELHGFTMLLGQVRKFVKQYRTANGQNVKHMMPGTTRITIQGGGNPSASQGSSSKGNKRPMTWFCIPYLALERYSGLMSATTTSSFPNETLLQHDYAASSRVRDMEQVVVRANVAKDGDCVHVNQLWGIVLDKSLLITCGQMPSSSLREDVIKIAIEPPLEAAVKPRPLYVSYGPSVIWRFSLDMCHTWFAFVKHFRDFWPQAFRFYHHEKPVTEHEWPRILNLAGHTTVMIELRLGAHPQSSITGVLQPLRIKVNSKGSDQTTDNNGPRQPTNNLNKFLPDSVNNVFHVFTWMDIAKPRATRSSGLDTSKITEQLENVHKYLISSTPRSERTSYEAGKLSSHEEVYRSLETNGRDIGSTQSEGRRMRWTACVDLYNDAEIVFRFFLPWRFPEGAPTIGKFWGAIKALTETLPAEPSRGQQHATSARQDTRVIVTGLADIKVVDSYLRAMARIIGLFQGILSHTSAADRDSISVPDSLIRAWLHLLTGLVGSTQDSDDWRENMQVAEALIKKGMEEIMESLSAQDLLTKAVIQPIELVSLLSWKLFQDSLSVGVTLSDTYSQSLKELENNIADNPDRSHQYRIGQLKKEVEIIQSVIRAQQKVVPGMIPPKPDQGIAGQTQEKRLIERRMDELDREKSRPSRARMVQTRRNAEAYYPYDIDAAYRDAELTGSNRDPDEFSKLWPIDPDGFAGFFAGECMSLLERRDSEFHDFLLEARRLEAYNMTNIDITKDKQEKAVYAFTMVTIIFLPLGTISSIFGMNTYDIANLELSQWVYWVTALPTTLIVIIGGLWWMGELQNLGRWFLRLPKARSTSVGNVARYPMAMAAQGQNPFAPTSTYYAVAPPPPPAPPQAMAYIAPSRRRYADY